MCSDISDEWLNRELLETTTDSLNLRSHVKFVGYQSQTEVRHPLQQIGIFVLPSFAEGVSVIATQIAGVSELVEQGIKSKIQTYDRALDSLNERKSPQNSISNLLFNFADLRQFSVRSRQQRQLWLILKDGHSLFHRQ